MINFTLAKFCGALFTVIIVALVKYSITGNFYIEYCEFFNNVAIGLLGWTINTATIGWLSEYLGIKGLNFNLKQIIYGFQTINICDGYSPQDIKAKLYHAMESEGEPNPNKGIDKGKGIDQGSRGYSDDNSKTVVPLTNQDESKHLDKGKGIDRSVHPFYNRGREVAPPTEPHLITWSRVFPGLDPTSVFFPKKINPGPGFNVPGGEVPIRDEICKHLDYNSNLLNQIKKMDLETAIEQRNNNLKLILVMDDKTAYGQGVLAKVPTIPTTEREFNLKNKILNDLADLSRTKVRAEARVTLLNSRIEFIEAHRNSNQ